MGNQQATTNIETDLAWLAGFLDGEGSFGIYFSTRQDQTKNYLPRIQVANTSAHGIRQVVGILDTLGIQCRMYEREFENVNWAKAYYLTVNRLAALARLLPLLIPYLIVKRPQAELMLRFVTSRTKTGINKGGNGSLKPYSEQDLEIIATLRELNQTGRGRLTDYTRSPSLEGDDIVGPLTKVKG